MRRMGSGLLALMVVLAATPVTAAGPGKLPAPAAAVEVLADLDQNGLFDNLEARLRGAAAHETFDVIVQFAAAEVYDAVEQAVGPLNYRARWSRAINGFAATLNRGQIMALGRVPGIKSVEPDLEVTAFMGTATAWTGVNQARADFGVNGDRDGNAAAYSKTDVVVAILDTGIDAKHVDLDGGKVIGWRDAVNGKAAPYDDNGHGTHVASITAGTGEGNAAYRGVAPGAALVGIKVLNKQGSGTTTQIINGIDWMISNKSTYGIRVGNMSLGSTGCSNGTDSLSVAVNNAVNNGIMMAVAAGNSGPNKCTIGSPAAAANAITVGALYDPGEKGWVVAEFSSRGPTADGRIKPDILTPGRYITAAKANSTNGYVVYSGTSMATPFLAGVVALMLDANYGLTDSGVKSILYDAANLKDFGPAGRDVDFGYGINLSYNAVRAAGSFTGSYSDGLGHSYHAGSLSATGAYQDWTFSVTDATKPIGISMIINNVSCGRFGCSPDFDIYLYSPSGAQVAAAEGVVRQEQILYQPTATGTYRLRVRSYFGSGSYFTDVSYK